MEHHDSLLKGQSHTFTSMTGYSGGHPELDRIIELLKINGKRYDVSGADSPMNVANFEYEYHFDDGGFVIYSGNYFFGTPGQGAFVRLSLVSKHFGGCSVNWVNLELSSLAGSKMSSQLLSGPVFRMKPARLQEL
jgi:hypothetical protein